MTLPNSYYLQFAKNIYTQCGEDGIIEQLFKDLKIKSGVVVEFGACDGIFLSNTINLWKNKTFKAVLIECDATKYQDLELNCGKSDNVECFNKFVNPDSNHEDSLDNILSRSKFKITSTNLALVSIDIDSCDYQVFESISKHLPKVVVIETNTNYGPDERFVSGSGSSLRSITELAESKGYQLICSTGNAFYVRNDLVDKLPKENYTVENLFVSTENVDILQRIDSEGKDYGELYWLSSKYKEFVEETKKQLIG